MRYGAELLEKTIVSLDRNEKLGTIHGYLLDPDERRVAAFVLEQAGAEQSFGVVPFSATKSIYSDAVIVENIPGPISVNDSPQLHELLLKDVRLTGAQVITETGMLAGTVLDFAFSDRTGDILTLRIDPEPGFPETFDIAKVIKIAKERIIISRAVYNEKEAAKPKPAAKPEPQPRIEAPVVAAPQPVQPRTEPAPQQPQPQPAPEPQQTPRVDAARFQSLFDQLKKDNAAETESLYNSLFKEQLRASFQEAVRLLMDRMNALDLEKHFPKFREEVSAELRETLEELVRKAVADAMPKPEEAPEVQGPTVEEIVSAKLHEATETLARGAAERTSRLEELLAALGAERKAASEELRAAFEAAAGESRELFREASAKTADEFARAAGNLDSTVKDILGAVPTEAQFTAPLDGLRAEIAESLKGAGGAGELSGEIEKLKAEVAGLKTGLAEDLKKVAADLREEVGGVRERVLFVLGEAADGLSEKASRAEAAAMGAPRAEALSAELAKIREDVAAGIQAAVEPLQQTVHELSGNAVDAAALERTADKLKYELTLILPELLQKNFEELRRMTEEISGAVSSGTGMDQVAEKLQGAVAESSAAAAEALAGVREDAAKLKEEISAAVSESAGALDGKVAVLAAEVEAARADVSKLKDEITNGVSRVLSGRLDEALTKVELVGELVETSRVEFREQAAAAAGSAAESIRADFASLKETIEFLKQQPGLLEDMLAGSSEQLFDRIRDAVDAAKSEIAAAAEKGAGVEEKISAVGDALGKAVEKIAEEQRSARSVVEAVRDAVDAAKSEFTAVAEKGAGVEEKISAVGDVLGKAVEKIAEEQRSARSVVEAVREAVDAAKSEFTVAAEKGAGVEEKISAVGDALGKAVEKIAEEQRSARSVVEAVREAVDAAKSEFTVAAEKGGVTEEKLDRLVASMGELAGRVDEGRKSAQTLLENIHAEIDSRLRAARNEIEDVMRGELARHADAAAAAGGESAHALRNLEKILIELAEGAKQAPPAELAEKIIAEVRSYAGQSVKHEDIAELRRWLEGNLQSLSTSLVAEAREKIGAVLNTAKALREETQLDLATFRHDLEKCHEDTREAIHTQLDNELERLQKNFDLEAVRAEVRGMASTAVDEIHSRVEKNFGQFKEDFQKAVADGAELKTILAGAVSQLPGAADSIKQEIRRAAEKAEAASKDSAERADAAREEAKKIDSLGARFEKSLRDSSDAILGHVERRLAERDENIEDAFRRTASAIEELAKRGPAAGLGDIFSGRIFGNIFGGTRAAEEPKRIPEQAHQKPKKTAGASGIVEAGQVRRLSYLIGKTVTRDIEGPAGEVVARAGDVVGEDTIRACRDAHRVLDLIRAVDLGG